MVTVLSGAPMTRRVLAPSPRPTGLAEAGVLPPKAAHIVSPSLKSLGVARRTGEGSEGRQRSERQSRSNRSAMGTPENCLL